MDGDGDFRSEECVELLKQADIVVTNPPFSIIDEYLDQLVKHGKKFLFIGPLMMMMRKSAFDLVKTEKMWPGLTWVKEFKTDDGEMQKFGNIVWYTNLDHEKRHEELVCVEKYSPEKYPAYANYPNAVEVGKIANIPVDYDGEMGVTVSYLMKHNPDQFEIVGGARWLATKMADMGWPKDSYVPGGVAFYLDESTPAKRRYRRLFGRIVIKRKKPVGEDGRDLAFTVEREKEWCRTSGCSYEEFEKKFPPVKMHGPGLMTSGQTKINGKSKYNRILIRRRKPAGENAETPAA